MAKIDPEKAARSKAIKELTEQINNLVPDVLDATGYKNVQSLNATYGGKHAIYIDIKNEVIDSEEQFISLYFQGFLKSLEDYSSYADKSNTYFRAYFNVKDNAVVRQWLELFLRRTYLREYESLSKVRPKIEESEVWIGQNNASYGILVTPRFKNGVWENDKSEIRKFKPKYWTIGHILQTGLLIPDREKCINFNTVEEYLNFFENIIVRNSGSMHEIAIAERYCQYVLEQEEPKLIPLLIPELRYAGKESKHEYRLDFTIIDSENMSKVGIEISPWSTHGNLTKTKNKTQKEINAEALKNFEKEMKKYKAYFRKFGIPIITYTDTDLTDHDRIFSEIISYLSPKSSAKKLVHQSILDFMKYGD